MPEIRSELFLQSQIHFLVVRSYYALTVLYITLTTSPFPSLPLSTRNLSHCLLTHSSFYCKVQNPSLCQDTSDQQLPSPLSVVALSHLLASKVGGQPLRSKKFWICFFPSDHNIEMGEVKKLLFITNSEFGQSSIFVSIIRELLSRQDSTEIHLLSFPSLRSRVADLLDGSNPNFKFHSLLSAPSFVSKQEESGPMTEFVSHSTGFFGSLASYRKMDKALMPWTPDEYLKIYHECCQVIKEVQPSLCVLDVLFFAAFDACEGLKLKYVNLTPVPFRGDQGLLRTFTYPA